MCVFFCRLGYNSRFGSDDCGFEDFSIDVTSRIHCFRLVRRVREHDPNGVPAYHEMIMSVPHMYQLDVESI